MKVYIASSACRPTLFHSPASLITEANTNKLDDVHGAGDYARSKCQHFMYHWIVAWYGQCIPEF